MTEELNQMETHLRAQLATLHESYEKAAKPIIDQIVRLRSMQPMPPIIIDLIRRAPQSQTTDEALMRTALARMEDARRILQKMDGGNWSILDTSDLRSCLSDPPVPAVEAQSKFPPHEIELSPDVLEVIRKQNEAAANFDFKGWVRWTGGECPIADGEHFHVQMRNGVNEVSEFPGDYYWKHTGGGGDIIAFKVSCDSVDPSTDEPVVEAMPERAIDTAARTGEPALFSYDPLGGKRTVRVIWPDGEGIDYIRNTPAQAIAKELTDKEIDHIENDYWSPGIKGAYFDVNGFARAIQQAIRGKA